MLMTVLMILTVSPSALAYSGNVSDKVLAISVDYPDFIQNMDYYNQLAAEGYLVHIKVGEQYKEQEEARLAELGKNNLESLTPTLTRGTAYPTSGWNLASQGQYNFSGRGPVYTNYYFNGKLDMNVYVHNSNSTQMKVHIFDSFISNTTAAAAFYVPGGDSVLYQYNRRVTSGKVAVYFLSNYFDGYIN